MHNGEGRDTAGRARTVLGKPGPSQAARKERQGDEKGLLNQHRGLPAGRGHHGVPSTQQLPLAPSPSPFGWREDAGWQAAVGSARIGRNPLISLVITATYGFAQLHSVNCLLWARQTDWAELLRFNPFAAPQSSLPPKTGLYPPVTLLLPTPRAFAQILSFQLRTPRRHSTSNQPDPPANFVCSVLITHTPRALGVLRDCVLLFVCQRSPSFLVHSDSVPSSPAGLVPMGGGSTPTSHSVSEHSFLHQICNATFPLLKAQKTEGFTS